MINLVRQFRSSILFGTAVGVIGITFVVGALFIVLTSTMTASVAQRQSSQRLGELLDTVENTAAIACFVEDPQLATELVRGLLKNSELASAAITVNGRELARAERDPARPAPTGEAVIRQIVSPFDKTKVVGEIRVEPNDEAIAMSVAEQTRFVRVLLALQLAIVAAAVVTLVLYAVVRPIKAMSDGLHRLDAPAGERLPAPAGHEDNEIGRLAHDINDLAGSLVDTLNQEHELRLQRELDERRYRSIFENAQSGIFVCNLEGKLDSCNPFFSRLAGLPEDGSAPDTFRLCQMPWREPARLTEMITECARSGSGQSADLEMTPEPAPQACRWLHVALSALGGGRVQGIVNDVTERKEAETAAQQLAVTDTLTGLANRLGTERHLTEHLRRSPDQPLAMMLIELSGFRQINDALGLPAGDQVLTITAFRLVGCLKSTDWVARIGGDEFAVVLHGVDNHTDAAKIGSRIVEALGQAIELDDAATFVSASIGIVLYPADGADLPALLRSAELALERVEVGGGKGFEFFHPAMVAAAEERRHLEADLRQSIQRGELRLYFQPIVDLAENRLAGAEALIRWQHPKRGLVPPDSFIPLAEETGLILDIGLWVVEAAAGQLAAWHAMGLEIHLSLNVSARQIPHGLPPAVLREAAGRHRLPPSALALEITEGVLLADVSKGLDWLNELRGAGFRTYLDDFGTGYSSLSYLKRFPMDTVKVDKSFVRDMGEDNSDRALVEAIVMMAKSLGLNVVAEGVENATQLDLLRRMGCRYGQGYYFSKPVAADDFPAAAERIAGLLAGNGQAMAAA